jgi:phosphoserine aminotransferase
LNIPDTHEVLFMQGGASGQFALVPMNFLHQGQSADYVITGTWSEKALIEARIQGDAREAANAKNDGAFTRVPTNEELELDPKAAFVHFTSNNTVAGTQFHSFPEVGDRPLVCDMSSDLLWRPIDVSKFDLIYAGAQKNLGPAGVTIVIIRKDLMATGREDIAKIFRYSVIAGKDSLYNTGPTFPIYVVRNVLSWVKDQGGAAAMEARNRQKSEMLYGLIDAKSSFYRSPIEKASRSVMNVVFRLPTEELEKSFISSCADAGMVGVKGHRSVGGIRISMYNAMEPSNIEKLADFMTDFCAQNS